MVNKTQKVARNLISVIIPLYGNFDPRRVLIAVNSIKQQRGVNIETIIVEESEHPHLLDVNLGENVRYYHRQVENLIERKFFIPGKIRNMAAGLSHGEFLYNNDGDIVFVNPYYLIELLDIMRQNPSIALYRPPMRRLPKECFEEFASLVARDGQQKAIETLDFSQPYIATVGKTKIKMRVFKKFESGREKIFLFTDRDHERYKSRPGGKGNEPLYSTLDVHAGGILMRRSQFNTVGGYCELYVGWGCHDSDLQWKLREIFMLNKIPNDPRFEVLHLDHSRDYFGRDRWLKNRKIQKERRERGVMAGINEDKPKLNQLYSKNG
jgi:GT2 family glycosyltransferase